MRSTPFIDVPIVVGLDHDLVDRSIRALVQHLAREASPVRKIQTSQLTACIHVANAFVDVPATRTHLVIARRIDVEILTGLSGHSIETEIATLEVAIPPLFNSVLVGENPWRELFVLRRHVCIEHVGWLSDVVIDTDQN